MTFPSDDPTGQGTKLIRPAGLLLLVYLFTFTLPEVSFPKSITVYKSEPIIKVCLSENRRSVTLRLEGKYRLLYQDVEISTLANSSITFSYSTEGTPLALLPGQRMEFYSPIEIAPDDSTEPSLSAGDPDGISFGSQTYPGGVEVVPESSASFRVINAVPLETYLRGVVPYELVNNLTPDELQACMAQAIAARNYAFFRMSNVDSFANGPRARGFDVYADTRDQVYSGISGYKPLADTAIALTKGMIVEYNDEPARCFFYSTCGGRTEAVQNVWQGQPPLPYLRSVSDIDSLTGEPFCIFNPNFYWSADFSGSQVNRMVRQNLALANPTYAGKNIHGDVVGVDVLNRFPSGRVDSLRISMDDGNKYYVRGDRIRYLFKTSNGALLKSDLFKLSVLTGYGGTIRRLILKGQGNGHGVGMCQWGALGMSKLGYSYSQILSHYYPGTVIKKVY